MKKIETTHLKASRVGGVDRRRQRRDKEVRVQRWEFERVSLKELRESKKAEMGRRCGSAADQRRGSEAWIGGFGLGSAWKFDEMGQLVGWWRWASMGWWRWGSSRAEGSEIERWEFERVSLRELRELRVFCLRACPLENKRIEKNKVTNIILINWRIINNFFFLALNYSA